MLRHLAARLTAPVHMALFGICVSSAVTAAPIQAQSSATISDLTWHLVDLKPDDGIAPSVQFFPEYDMYGGSAAVNGGIQYGFSLDANPIPWPSKTDQIGNAGNALAMISPTSLTTSVVIEGGLPAIWASNPGQDYFYSRVAYIADMGSLANGISIKLGANTGIVLEGQAEVQTMVDLAQVVGSPYFTERPYAAVTLRGNAWIHADLHRQGGDVADITGSQWRLDAAVTDNIDIYQLASFVADPKSQTETGDFQLTFFNATAGEAQGILKLGIYSNISASGVPELGAWLMWALGLSALVLMARRPQTGGRGC